MVSLHVPVKISCVTLCIIFPAFPCLWASQVLLSHYPSYIACKFKIGWSNYFFGGRSINSYFVNNKGPLKEVKMRSYL